MCRKSQKIDPALWWRYTRTDNWTFQHVYGIPVTNLTAFKGEERKHCYDFNVCGVPWRSNV